MNTQHLQYLIEIERMRSISQAAENLYIGQPNLSRILHEMEQDVGFAIFERTSRGVRPTERGADFLRHARSILREVDSIDALGPRHSVPNRLRVCLPRSATQFDAAAEYLTTLSDSENFEVNVKECFARQALEMVANGEAEIGVIRFRSDYYDYFQEQTSAGNLSFQQLARFEYQLVLAKDHPLAPEKTVTQEMLFEYTEIAHGTLPRGRSKSEEQKNRRIYTVDRMAQMQLLSSIWGAYMWSEPIAKRYLQTWGLTQKTCAGNRPSYCDALIFHPQYAMNDLEAGFVRQMIRTAHSSSRIYEK